MTRWDGIANATFSFTSNLTALSLPPCRTDKRKLNPLSLPVRVRCQSEARHTRPRSPHHRRQPTNGHIHNHGHSLTRTRTPTEPSWRRLALTACPPRVCKPRSTRLRFPRPTKIYYSDSNSNSSSYRASIRTRNMSSHTPNLRLHLLFRPPTQNHARPHPPSSKLTYNSNSKPSTSSTSSTR